jgi:hypothetical protein
MKIPSWDEHQLYSNSRTTATRSCTGTCKRCSSSSCCPGTSDANDDHDKRTAKSQTPSVMFSDQDSVIHNVLSLSEFSDDEVRACWFSRGEYNSFKRNSLLTLSLNRTGDLSPDDPEHSMRGLECRTRELTDSRRILRYRAATAVFEEQARQRGTGVRDPEALSECYHSISWHGMYDAHCQGLADEQDCLPVFTMEAAENEGDLFAVPMGATSNKRNTVLSKIISFDRIEPEEDEAIAGFQSHLWSSDAPFNVNSFFNEMSLGIVVAAA